MTHRFRFGLLGENACSATVLSETARRAEAAGFATFLRVIAAIIRDETTRWNEERELRRRLAEREPR